ncbi:hypothetical protein DL764_004887 [Monosporascus ibericus]|uniref:Senescence domain-containing protein n=1 Tax=Monosporascus ibericus TaxID=155417 RepID=A0A4Q4TAY9_9PEZI|nr:hypothetical protein DL764_004887 [Monosporascus ibericus]
MASGHNDPKLLYAIEGVSAYQLAHGKEESLTPAGPQTLSLLMVPTSSPFAEPPPYEAIDSAEAPREDFYLHLHLPPELDIPLPATTQIYHQPPRSYLIPRWDLGPDSGAFTRLEFPPVGSRRGLQEDVDTFETILAQCTAFLERAPPPRIADKEKSSAASSTKSSSTMEKSKAPAEEQLPAYNPADYKPGQAYVQGSHSVPQGGQIVLVDEEDGRILGELGDSFEVADSGVRPGSKGAKYKKDPPLPVPYRFRTNNAVDPVEITLPAEGESNKVEVIPASPEALEIELHPAYQKSFLVSKATYASRLLITGSQVVANTMQSGSNTFVKNVKPVNKPVTFKPATHERARKIGKFSGDVAGLSAKTVGQVTKVAQNVGATIAGRGNKDRAGRKGYGPDGQPLENYKPGLLNRSMMAFSTVSDGIEHAARNLMTSAATTANTMVTHRWGDEAGELSKHLSGGVKNVGLVYIDVTGVSRRAVIKAVGKGMVIGKVKGGGEIVVGDDTSSAQAHPARGANNNSRANSFRDTASVNGPSTTEAKR